MWIEFFDMHSGGKAKLPPYEEIYIEAASQEKAEIIFYNRFNRNPNNITCRCCGEDYSVYEVENPKKSTTSLIISRRKVKPTERYVSFKNQMITQILLARGD